MVFDRLQILRFFAAAAVVAFHVHLAALSYMPNGPHLGWLAHGFYGVDLFFVISGFIMVYMARTRETAAGLFLRRRVERIVPLYWVMTFAAFAVLSVPALVRSDDPTTAMDLIRSLTFTAWTAGKAPLVHVGWTLEWEMLFYLLFAGGLVLRRRLSWSATWPVVIVLVIAILTRRFAISDEKNAWANFLGAPIMLEFAFGMAVARLSFEGRRALPFALIAFLPVLAVLGDRPGIGGLPAAAIVALAVWLDRRAPVTGRLNAILVRLGDASYSIYLAQVFPISGLFKVIVRIAPGMSPVLATVLVTVTTIALGYVVFVLIERPLRTLIRRRQGARPIPTSP